MSKSSTPDEQPKRDIAKQVISAKRQYFLPDSGLTVEADDSVEAESHMKKLKAKKDKKVGDGE